MGINDRAGNDRGTSSRENLAASHKDFEIDRDWHGDHQCLGGEDSD